MNADKYPYIRIIIIQTSETANGLIKNNNYRNNYKNQKIREMQYIILQCYGYY